MRKEIKLSQRLLAVASMVTKGNRVCDVGCDHGFVSVYLVLEDMSPRVIAMDVNEGPLQAAREHVEAWGLTDYIDIRLSDGVSALRVGEADTLICAGMGGRLIIRILEAGRDRIEGMKELILQPQSELQSVREYLRRQGYRITEEHMILEDGKFYPMMKVCTAPDGETAEHETVGYISVESLKLEDKFGPVLLRRKDAVLKEYLYRELKICGQILKNLQLNGRNTDERQREIQDKLKDVKAALLIVDAQGE